jgi:uncharacterized protein YecE (DUF72 family)
MATQLGLFDDDPAPEASRAGPHPAGAGGRRRVEPVRPVAAPERLARLAASLPAGLRLGTSSWSFPGWEGLVYASRRQGRPETEARLARTGLAAYAAHPLFRTVSLDRTFYAPLSTTDFARYAADVPDDFRFVVKAPAAVTDPVVRGVGPARSGGANATFLDAATAREAFVRPAVEGLGGKAGPLVFQFPPLGRKLLADPGRMAARIAAFIAALPRWARYAVEVRDPVLASATLARGLADAGAVPCLAVHARMPAVAEQAGALAVSQGNGPLVVRWNLHAGRGYEEARDEYRPFDRLVEEDPPTRRALAALAMRVAAEGREVFITVNNKAEGCAPLSVERLAEACAAAPPIQCLPPHASAGRPAP